MRDLWSVPPLLSAVDEGGWEMGQKMKLMVKRGLLRIVYIIIIFIMAAY